MRPISVIASAEEACPLSDLPGPTTLADLGPDGASKSQDLHDLHPPLCIF